MNNVQKIIKEICDEKNISFKLVSNNWIIILEKDNQKKYIVGYKFPLNNQSVGKICDDKYAVYEIAKNFNIPVADHFIVFKDHNKKEIIEYSKQYNYNVVVKDNCGTCGKNMYHVKNQNELLKRIKELLKITDAITISPYYNIKTEYRNIILNDEIELTYGKKKPIVVGNNKNTIYELLCEFNNEYFKKIPNNKLNRVLRNNETYEYNWQFNLSKGSMPFLLEDKDKENKIKQLAKNIAKVFGTKFASIDLIELEDNTILLLEINSGVMMDSIIINLEDGKQLVKNIYSKAIDEMFK